MKYAIIIPDGCADEPQQALAGRTPLQAARVPAMDEVAQAGVVGRAYHVPESLPAGSDVANLSLLGYDPLAHYTGRAPLEAAAQGITLGEHDWALRCNLVTIEDQVMRDFTADHISTDEAEQLLRDLADHLEDLPVELHAGVGYRNLMIYRSDGSEIPFSKDTRTTPPHDLTDKSVADDFPRGPGSHVLHEIMSRSMSLFADHPVNHARRDRDRLPATNVWLWGEGQKPRLRTFQELYGMSGVMITAVDLLRGLAQLLDWRRLEVPGATGYTDTDYAAKGAYAVKALEEADLVCVHVEAPDEASHEGDLETKIQTLEEIDRNIVAPVWEALQGYGDFRIVVSPDHPTPLRTKTHSHDPVPLAAAGTGIESDDSTRYDEPTADASSLFFQPGWHMMKWFITQS